MRKLGFILIFLSGLFICNAQVWNSGEGISNEIVRDVIGYNIDTLLAGVDNNGIFISYDNGKHWSQYSLQGETVYSLIKIGNSIIAGTYGNDIYMTDAIDSLWKNIPVSDLVFNRLKLHNDTIFACTYGTTGPGAVYISADTGISWNQYIEASPYAYLDIDFNHNGRAYVATPIGAYFADNRSPWIQTTGNGGTTRSVNYIANDSIIYGGDFNIYLSADNGVSSNALDNILGGRTFFIDDTIYISTVSGLMYTSELSKGLKSLGLFYVNILTKINNKLVAGTDMGVYTYAGTTTNIYSINDNDISIFPNPTTEIINIKSVDPYKFSIEIYNLNGQKILLSENLNIDISNFDSGMYICKFKSNNSTIYKKIIKK